ncbi:potassium transporter KefC [Longibacter salinarum]|uniref:Potassium transporter KefC n=1 Tax=Longibacter salinarum TaxID=1850348 RepID=A0A2A8CYT0_9BACT|nr:cation:proton antiporter family protein [Longibacter salinarum]PEN13862.1 potassium transporter KefC [Longibacter salinarum]
MPDLLFEIGWIIVAFAAGLGARVLRLPPLVGYLAAGMVLATFGVEGSTVVEQIGNLGVALVLFIIGLDLRLRNLVEMEVLGVGGLHIVLWTVVVTGIGMALGLPLLGAIAVAAGLSASSLVLAAKSLEAQHDLRSYHGRVAIGIILVQTVVATGAIAAMGEPPSLWALAVIPVIALRPLLARLLDALGRGEMLLLFGLALAAAGSLLFDAVGLSAELGALTAGALLAGHDRTDDLSDAVGTLKDAFLPAFFLSVGLIGLPDASGLGVVAGLLGLLAVKGALYVGLFSAFRLRARTSFLAAMPLTTYSGLSLIVASAAVAENLLPESMLTALALATAGSYLVNAPLARQAPDLWTKVSDWLQPLQRSGRPRDARPETLGRARFVVVGMGRVGTAAYDYLAARMQCPAGVDEDPGKLARHRSNGRRVLYGDARDATLWADLGLETVEAVVLALPDRDATLAAVSALREAGFEGPVSALTTDPEGRQDLIDAGASAVYLSGEQVGQALARHGLRRRQRTVPAAVTLDVGAEQRPSAPLRPSRGTEPLEA